MPTLPAHVGLTEPDVVFNVMATNAVASIEYLVKVDISYVLVSSGATYQKTLQVQVSNDLTRVALQR